MPATLPRHYLLLPLLFLLAVLVPQQVQHIRYGDAIGGALGAGAREAASGLTKGKSDATQQWASTIIGAVAGGGTGAATALQGEKYNRQLHQREIALIRDNAAAFARQKGISLAKARAMLAQAALHNVDSFYAGTNVDPDAERFIENLARTHGGTFKDNQGRTQHLFDERGNAMYDRHAVNANTVFDPEAQDLYRSTGYNPANIARSIANSAQLQKESAATQKAFITHAVDAAKSTGNAAYRDAAIRATVDARRNGVVKASYDTSTPVGWAMDQNIKNYGKAIAAASVGNLKSSGNVVVRLANGKRVEVPKEAVVKGSDGRIFIKETYTTPSGRTYNFYGQKIDLDLKIKNPRTGKYETNRERMKKGNNPYVLDSNGNPVPTNQHHSQQRADGPIFELKTPTHQNPTNQSALHPHGKNKNPYNPVNHKEWNKDRQHINKERVKHMEKMEVN